MIELTKANAQAFFPYEEEYTEEITPKDIMNMSASEQASMLGKIELAIEVKYHNTTERPIRYVVIDGARYNINPCTEA